MAIISLSPEIDPILTDEEFEEDSTVVQTYKIDFENGRLTNEIITGLEAVKQFIYISLRTPRYDYAIYSDDIGSEIEELMKEKDVSIEYRKMELERLVREALIYDERIDGVTNFQIDHIDDEFHVSFVVETVEGTIDMEEVF